MAEIGAIPALKKELVFDIHFVHGPRRFVGLTKEGLRFIQTFPFDDLFYQTAIDNGLHVSFEDEALRDRIIKESDPAIQ